MPGHLPLSLHALLDYLSTSPPGDPCVWRDWRITPVSGGFNNRLFRASGPAGDLAVKFTRRDTRDRAGREFAALALLENLGLDLAPKPVLLERERYPQPVIVQTWEKGVASPDLPDGPDEWQRLLDHYTTLHAIQSAAADRLFPQAVLTFDSAPAAVDAILREMQPLLQAADPPVRPWQPPLSSLAARLEAARFPSWPAPQPVLARCDPTLRNFLRRDGPWCSVDWENSGWGDPAFEFGDLLAHPDYRPLTAGQREDILQMAAARHPGDPTFALRASIFGAIILVRWVGLRARYWRERDLGLSDASRLAQLPPGWWESLPDEFWRDLPRAQEALAVRGA